MSHIIRHPKDFWSGVMFMFFGLAAVWIGQEYPMGTAGRMGPAYFPVVLGGLLSLIGAIALVRSFIVRGEPLEKFAVKPLVLIILAVVLFGFLVRGAGMVVAVSVLVLVSACASQRFNLVHSLLLAAGAALFCVAVFVWGLGLPLPVFGPWFGQ